jgi:predicted metal-dependent phosphotriesterase family hydrolase
MEGVPSTNIECRRYIDSILQVSEFSNTNIICALGSKSQFTWLRL